MKEKEQLTYTLKKIIQCARCGEDHEDIIFERFQRPHQDNPTSTEYTHWATCPITQQPMLLAVFED